jgi:hypothetical protein
VLKLRLPKCSNGKKVFVVEIANVVIGVAVLIRPKNGSSGSIIPVVKKFCGKRILKITREIEASLQVLARTHGSRYA